MKAFLATSFALSMLSLAATSFADSSTGGPIDPATGRVLAARTAAPRFDDSGRAPDGTLAALHPSDRVGTERARAFSITMPDGTIVALHPSRPAGRAADTGFDPMPSDATSAGY